MPNYCYQTITIVGTPDELDRFEKQFNAESNLDAKGNLQWLQDPADRQSWLYFRDMSWCPGCNPVERQTYKLIIRGSSKYGPWGNAWGQISAKFAFCIFIDANTADEFFEVTMYLNGDCYPLEEWIEYWPIGRRRVTIEDGTVSDFEREEDQEDDPLNPAVLNEIDRIMHVGPQAPLVDSSPITIGHHDRAIKRTNRRIEESVQRARDGVLGFLPDAVEDIND